MSKKKDESAQEQGFQGEEKPTKGKKRTVDPMEIEITPEMAKGVLVILDHMTKLDMAKEALKEDMEAMAAKFNIKPAALKSIADMVKKEREEGGVIEEKEKQTDFARKVIEKVLGEQPEQD